MNQTSPLDPQITRLRQALDDADAVLIGAGAGLSASAGFDYSGERFTRHFADFIDRYHFRDMYSAGFYQFPTPEEQWAFWSRYILINRYEEPPKDTYEVLLDLVHDKDYFVLTTNVDHCFQKAGFDKARLFYTQGDYGLWQCSIPCCPKTYDNESTIREMVARQKDMRIPSDLVPHCPVCGAPMAMNLRSDGTFVEDQGWHRAMNRYQTFVRQHHDMDVLLLELGVGGNTPGIIKFPFWRLTAQEPGFTYACVTLNDAVCPPQIADQSICISADIDTVLRDLAAET